MGKMASILGMALMMGAGSFAQKSERPVRKLKEKTSFRNKPTKRREKVKSSRKANLKRIILNKKK